MTRTLPRPVVRGTRPELVAELERLAEGWWHLGNNRMQHASELGAHQLGLGAPSVQVGHTVYEVTENTSVS